MGNLITYLNLQKDHQIFFENFKLFVRQKDWLKL